MSDNLLVQKSYKNNYGEIIDKMKSKYKENSLDLGSVVLDITFLNIFTQNSRLLLQNPNEIFDLSMKYLDEYVKSINYHDVASFYTFFSLLELISKNPKIQNLDSLLNFNKTLGVVCNKSLKPLRNNQMITLYTILENIYTDLNLDGISLGLIEDNLIVTSSFILPYISRNEKKIFKNSFIESIYAVIQAKDIFNLELSIEDSYYKLPSSATSLLTKRSPFSVLFSRLSPQYNI